MQEPVSHVTPDGRFPVRVSQHSQPTAVVYAVMSVQ